MYTVKQVTALLGLSAHTVRYYTDMDMIPTLKRDKNNNRLFDEEAMNWMKAIKILRGCGMSLEAIRYYLDLCLKGDSTIGERYEIFKKQKALVDKRIREIRQHADFLDMKLIHYKEIMDNQIPDDTNPAKWTVKPERVEV